MPNKIPRPAKGSPVRAEDLWALADAVERCQILSSGDVTPQQTRAGTALVFGGGGTRYAIEFLASATVAKMTGTTPGTGSGHVVTVDGSGAFVSTGESVTLYNLTEKNVSSGAYGVAVRCGPRWQVVLVDKCSNLT